MTTREILEEVARRGDPEEWLNVLQHEATRANNAEAAVEPLIEIARAARALFSSGLSDPLRSVIFDPHGAVDEIEALAAALRGGGFE